jgi:hypothetical protein
MRVVAGKLYPQKHGRAPDYGEEQDLTTINETINGLTDAIATGKQSLDDALFALQTWLDQNTGLMSEDELQAFSETLNAEKDTQVRDGKPYGDDQSLVASVLRLHAMRLLYRMGEQRRGAPKTQDNSPYERAKRRLQLALREIDIAINEARVDTTIANAHNILADERANRRWLQDALARLQAVSAKNTVKLADAVPIPDLPRLSIFQRLTFRVLGIRQEELARRSLLSLRQVAVLQHEQLVEMAKLLADSFEAIGDDPGKQQALALLTKLELVG